MYLGMTLILLGIALLLDSATPFAVAVAIVVFFDRHFIVREQPLLEETFRGSVPTVHSSGAKIELITQRPNNALQSYFLNGQDL